MYPTLMLESKQKGGGGDKNTKKFLPKFFSEKKRGLPRMSPYNSKSMTVGKRKR